MLSRPKNHSEICPSSCTAPALHSQFTIRCNHSETVPEMSQKDLRQIVRAFCLPLWHRCRSLILPQHHVHASTCGVKRCSIPAPRKIDVSQIHQFTPARLLLGRLMADGLPGVGTALGCPLGWSRSSNPGCYPARGIGCSSSSCQHKQSLRIRPTNHEQRQIACVLTLDYQPCCRSSGQ